jgi:hypothetical protein
MTSGHFTSSYGSQAQALWTSWQRWSRHRRLGIAGGLMRGQHILIGAAELRMLMTAFPPDAALRKGGSNWQEVCEMSCPEFQSLIARWSCSLPPRCMGIACGKGRPPHYLEPCKISHRSPPRNRNFCRRGKTQADDRLLDQLVWLNEPASFSFSEERLVGK